MGNQGTRTPGLNFIFTQENLMKLVEDKEIREALVEHLPDEQQKEDFLEANLTSP